MLPKTLTTLALALAIATPALAFNLSGPATASLSVPGNTPQQQEVKVSLPAIPIHHDMKVSYMDSSLRESDGPHVYNSNISIVSEEVWASLEDGSGNVLAIVFVPLQYEIAGPANAFARRVYGKRLDLSDTTAAGTAKQVVFTAVWIVQNNDRAGAHNASLTLSVGTEQ